MKEALRRNGRNVVSLMLTIVFMVSMTTNVFAGIGNTYIEETWSDSQQRINYYENDQFRRYIITQGHYLWIDNQLVFKNLYDTTYWCFERDGTCFAIDTSQRLLYCRNNSLDFVLTSVNGCTGFQRDNDGFGYLVYTNSGVTYSLNTLIKGKLNVSNNNNYNNNYNSDYWYEEQSYPYIKVSGNYYYCYMTASKYYKYYLAGTSLYDKGTNSTSKSTLMATDVQDITFDISNGYIVYADSNDNVLAYPLGKTTSTYQKYVGRYWSYFDKYQNISQGYYNTSGYYVGFTYNNYEEYPYLKVSGDYWYYYTSSSRYYKYCWTDTTLYDKGTNSNSKSIKLATNVKDITFYYDGHNHYIVYAIEKGYVYAYQVGKTSSKKTVGKYFESFEEGGYRDKYGNFNWFDF